MAEMAIVTIIMLVQFMYFSIEVGKMRQKHGAKAPVMSGHEEYERSNRIHQNTMEQLVVIIPAMWIFGQFFNPLYAAGLGAVYVVARFVYRAAYMKDPSGRTIGFTTGFLAMAALVLGGLVGAVMKLM
jgi:glutathione S-transferase